MTTPMPQPRQSPRNFGRGARNSSTAMQTQLSQMVTDMKTAVNLMSQTSTAVKDAAREISTGFKQNKAQMDTLISLLSTGGPTGFGSVRIGGLWTPSPLNNRPYLNQQGGGGWPGGQYPGGSSYGMGTQGHGGLGGNPQSMAGIRNLAANAMHQRMGMGQFTSAPAGTDPNTGQPIFQLYNQQGQAQGSPGTHGQLMQQFGAARLASSVAGGLGGGGIGSAARAVPGVGAALAIGEGVYQGAAFIADQRKANASYQAIYGGSNLNAMKQRMHQEGFALGSPFSGGMTSSDARQAFQQVSAMGYDGHARNQRLGFIQQNYKSMGISPQDSMQLVATSAQTLTTSLADLHTQLQAVSDVAGKTGQNAEVLRKSYMNNFAAMSSIGPGAGAVAAANTIATVGQGRNNATLNYSAMTSTGQGLDLLSSYVGLPSGGALLQQQVTDPNAIPRAQDAEINASMVSIMGAPMLAKIKSMITTAGGPPALAGAGGDSIAEGIVDNSGILTLVDPAGIDALMKAFQTDTTGMQPKQKYISLVHAIAFQMGGGIAGQTSGMQNKVLTGKAASAAFKGTAKGDGSGVPYINTQGKVTNSRGDLGVTVARTTAADQAAYQKANPGQGTGPKFKIGSVNQSIVSLQEDIGKGGYVQVHVKGGGLQVVTLEEAVKHYKDQIDDGTAILVSGDHPGQTVGAVYGVTKGVHDTSTKNTDPAKVHGALGSAANAKKIMAVGPLSDADLVKVADVEKKKGDKAALDEAKKLYKDQKSAEKKSKGTIELYMQPALANYIGATTTGDVAQNGAPNVIPNTGSSYQPKNP